MPLTGYNRVAQTRSVPVPVNWLCVCLFFVPINCKMLIFWGFLFQWLVLVLHVGEANCPGKSKCTHIYVGYIMAFVRPVTVRHSVKTHLWTAHPVRYGPGSLIRRVRSGSLCHILNVYLAALIQVVCWPPFPNICVCRDLRASNFP